MQAKLSDKIIRADPKSVLVGKNNNNKKTIFFLGLIN